MLARLPGYHSEVMTVAFRRRSSELCVLAGTADGSLLFWTPSNRMSVPAHFIRLHSLDSSSDGRHIASVSSTGLIHVWDAEALGREPVLHGNIGEVTAIARSPTGMQAASGDKSGRIVMWDTATGTRRFFRRTPSYAAWLWFTRDGQHLISNGAWKVLWSADGDFLLAVLLRYSPVFPGRAEGEGLHRYAQRVARAAWALIREGRQAVGEADDRSGAWILRTEGVDTCAVARATGIGCAWYPKLISSPLRLSGRTGWIAAVGNHTEILALEGQIDVAAAACGSRPCGPQAATQWRRLPGLLSAEEHVSELGERLCRCVRAWILGTALLGLAAHRCVSIWTLSFWGLVLTCPVVFWQTVAFALPGVAGRREKTVLVAACLVAPLVVALVAVVLWPIDLLWGMLLKAPLRSGIATLGAKVLLVSSAGSLLANALAGSAAFMTGAAALNARRRVRLVGLSTALFCLALPSVVFAAGLLVLVLGLTVVEAIKLLPRRRGPRSA